jgi:hypothetical protein
MAKQSDDYFANIELLGDAIGLLIGDRNEEFDLERALRLFQLKCWLINKFELTTSFNWSKKLFTSLSIGVAERANRLSHLTPAERFTLLFSTGSRQGLINHAFDDKDFFYLIRATWNPFRKDDVKHDYDDIRFLNNYTRLRFALCSNSNIQPSRNNAEILLSKGTMEPYCSESTIKIISKERRCREMFLFVLDVHYPNFLQFEPSRVKTYNKLKTDAEDQDYFREFFSKVKYLTNVLDTDLAEKLASFWPNLETQEIPPLDPLTQGQLDIAGIKPSRRRSAETTKLAVRQTPVGSK